MIFFLFVKNSNDKIFIAAVYIYDVILTGDDIGSINSLKAHLHKVFSIKDLGKLHYFLGIEVNYTSNWYFFDSV